MDIRFWKYIRDDTILSEGEGGHGGGGSVIRRVIRRLGPGYRVTALL